MTSGRVPFFREMKRCVKRHSRNSLHLLIEHERRRELDDDFENGGTGGLGAVPESANGHIESAPVFQQVAYYENPGILMIVQSVEDHNNFQGKVG